MTWKTVLVDIVFAYSEFLLMVTNPPLPFGKPCIFHLSPHGLGRAESSPGQR